MSEPTDKPLPERVQSGIPGLDLILRGGFLRGGIYIIQGTPGSGKTILANQMCYHHAAAGHRALYVTLLAENHARMMLHLGSLAFYNPTRVANTISYISGFRVMEEEGLSGLLALLGREVRGRQATLLILDGLVSVEQKAASRPEFKKFIQLLQTQAALSDCTMFLLASGADQVVSPEHTMADGLIDLHDGLYGSRAERDLHVRKFRGSGFLRGRHAFTITADGITVYPRIETLLAEPLVPLPPSPGEQERMRMGIAELDKMLGGGLPRLSTTMVLGPSGSGKTTLGMHFLAGSTAAEPGLFFGFYETPDRIHARARERQPALASLMDSGAVEIMWHPPAEYLLDDLAGGLLKAVRHRKARRVFIDGLGGFQLAATEPVRMERFVAAMANELRRSGATTLHTIESPDILGPSIAAPVRDLSSKAENLILLRYVEFRSELHRIISILKMRDSAFDMTLRRFVIRQQGIVVEDSFVGAEAVLSGYARDRRGGDGEHAAPTGGSEAS